MKHELFVRAWLAAPLRMGALSPSSEPICRAIAKHAITGRDGAIIELGSGTGEITQALLSEGVEPEQLYLVELLPEFCEILRRNFPSATVLQGDVRDALLTLGQREDRPAVSAVVSSLPIVWFPLADQRTIIEGAFALMGSHGRFLQLTYLPTSPLPMKKLGLKGQMIARIWRHSIPGMIWHYERAST